MCNEMKKSENPKGMKILIFLIIFSQRWNFKKNEVNMSKN